LESHLVPVGKLEPYANNPRTHSDDQVQQIVRSIREWGWTMPILVDDQMGVIAGHGRLQAAKVMGYESVPVVIAKGWTDEQKRAYVIADNQLTINGGWDSDLLAMEIKGLDDLGFDLNLLGLADKELQGLLSTDDGPPNALEDPPVPDLQDTAIARPGDVWCLGQHRVTCGDATAGPTWRRLQIHGDVVTFTSPPYNLGTGMALRTNVSEEPKQTSAYVGTDDAMESTQYLALLDGLTKQALAWTKGAVFNVQPVAGNKRELVLWMAANASHLCDTITWDKGHAAPVPAFGVVSSTFEWLVVLSPDHQASRRVPLSTWRGTMQSVYRGPRQTNNQYAAVHGATFPIHLPAYVITQLADGCAGVVDCCLGTGTTLMAAEASGKVCYGIDIEPLYVDLAVRRWQQATGRRAHLEDTGAEFDDMLGVLG
jgi:hypothetical protein